MRTSLSAVSLSALLLSASGIDALPSSRRLSVEVDLPIAENVSVTSPISPTSPSESPSSNSKQSIPLHHRRGSEELMNDDGTLDFGKAHAHLARARAKYTRGLKNFKLNTGSAHFLAPNFVDPSLLPNSSPSPSIPEVPAAAVGRMGRRGTVWGNGDEESLEWTREESTSSDLEKKDRIFDPSTHRPGAPAAIANPKALERRATRPKNPKVIINPKNAQRTATSTLATRSTVAAARQSGSVPLTMWNDNSIWTGSLSIGSTSQPFLINFDTGSADLWVPSTSCTAAACSKHSKYNPSKSTTAKSVSGKKLSITYGDGSQTKGVVYTDTVNIAGMSIPSQTLGAANALTSDFANDPYDGLMGMAFSSISTLGAPTVFESLASQAKLVANQFSFYLASAGSQLYLGGLDSTKFRAGSTKYYPVTSAGYWLIDARANIGGKQVGSTVSAIIDTGTSVIVAPTADAAAFWAAVPNSGEYGSGYYTYNCASPPDFSFSFGGGFAERWAVSGDSFNLGRVSSGSSRCVGAVVGVDIGINGWILGDAFLENVYTTFDISSKTVGFSDLA